MNNTKKPSRKKVILILFVAYLILREFGFPSLNLYKYESYPLARKTSLTSGLFANNSFDIKIIKGPDTLLMLGDTTGEKVFFKFDSVSTGFSSFIPLYKSFTSSVYFSCYQGGVFKGQVKISDHEKVIGLFSQWEKNHLVLRRAVNELQKIIMEKHLVVDESERFNFSSITMWPNQVSLIYPYVFRERFGNDYFPYHTIKPSIARGDIWTDTLYLDPTKYHGLRTNIIHLNYQDSIVESTLLYESGKIGFNKRCKFLGLFPIDKKKVPFVLKSVDSNEFRTWYANCSGPLYFYGPNGELIWDVKME